MNTLHTYYNWVETVE